MELLGIGTETGSRDGDQQRRRGHAQRGDPNQDQEQDAGNAIDQCFGLGFAATVAVFGKDGNESLGEGTLREQSAQQVGQAKGDKESVGHQAGAEGPGNDKITDEAQDAGQQGHAADGGQYTEQIHGGYGIRDVAGRSRLQWEEDPPIIARFPKIYRISTWPIPFKPANVPVKRPNSVRTT